jgi:hypothetical protein
MVLSTGEEGGEGLTHTDSNRLLSGLGKNPAGVRAKPWTAGRPLRARSRMHHARAKPSAQGGDECTDTASIIPRGV